jgi:hypothetical protein
MGRNARATVEAGYSSKVLYGRLSALIEAIERHQLAETPKDVTKLYKTGTSI